MRRSKATHCGDDLGVPATVPTLSIVATCCARAAIGQAVAQPNSVMNSRRLTGRIASDPSWSAVQDIGLTGISQPWTSYSRRVRITPHGKIGARSAVPSCHPRCAAFRRVPHGAFRLRNGLAALTNSEGQAFGRSGRSMMSSNLDGMTRQVRRLDGLENVAAAIARFVILLKLRFPSRVRLPWDNPKKIRGSERVRRAEGQPRR